MSASSVRAEPVEALIDAKGITTYYGASHILRGIDFWVASGQTLGLMGRHGRVNIPLLQNLLDQHRKAIEALAHVGRSACQPHPDSTGPGHPRK